MATSTMSATLDQRAAGRLRAMAKRRANAVRLRSDFHRDDVTEWQLLAAAAGVRLPPWGVPVTTAAMKRWLARLAISTGGYLMSYGRLCPQPRRGEAALPTLAEVARHYDAQHWPLKAWVGLLLEALASGHLTLCREARQWRTSECTGGRSVSHPEPAP